MKKLKKVRFGVVGLGMGGLHCRDIVKEAGKDFSLGAICDINEARVRKFAGELKVPYFTDAQEMYDSGLVDAVIVATPHYWHVPLALRAARAGLHVLCEKPLSSTVGPARQMIAECRKRKVALGAMLQHRTRGIMVKMKQMVDSGAIGEVFRVSMICSNWHRTQAYYDSGQWRGTWDGEGGGVLINQAPHHLDLFTWIGGMPRRVTGVLDTRLHKIEVEDAANFICEYGNGKIGYFYATTAEQPGMEQFMVCGDKATLIAEGGRLRMGRLRVPLKEYTMSSENSAADSGKNATTWSDVEIPHRPSGHIEIIRAFAAHLLRGTPLYADGRDALNELQLSNAMYLAGYKNKPVDLPIDDQEIEKLIARLIRERSTGRGGNLRGAATRDLRKLMGK
ncbi:MAG: Gfo/Idh/MocA family oxidoreductase [Phycisphaerae bacterium]|jgi:predicted dehydrogenase